MSLRVTNQLMKLLLLLVMSLSVISCGGGGGDTPSSQVTAPASLQSAKIVSAVSSSKNQIQLDWLPASSGSSSSLAYEIHLSTTTGFVPDSSTLKATINGTISADISDLTPSTVYYIIVVAIDGTGTKANSEEFSVTTSENDVTVKADLNVLSEEQIADDKVVAISATAISLTNDPAVATPEVGDILSNIGGDGQLRRVVSVSDTGSTTEVTTEPVGVEEVFDNFSVNLTTTLVDPTASEQIDSSRALFRSVQLPSSTSANQTTSQVEWPNGGLKFEQRRSGSGNQTAAVANRAMSSAKAVDISTIGVSENGDLAVRYPAGVALYVGASLSSNLAITVDKFRVSYGMTTKAELKSPDGTKKTLFPHFSLEQDSLYHHIDINWTPTKADLASNRSPHLLTVTVDQATDCALFENCDRVTVEIPVYVIQIGDEALVGDVTTLSFGTFVDANGNRQFKGWNSGNVSAVIEKTRQLVESGRNGQLKRTLNDDIEGLIDIGLDQDDFNTLKDLQDKPFSEYTDADQEELNKILTRVEPLAPAQNFSHILNKIKMRDETVNCDNAAYAPCQSRIDIAVKNIKFQPKFEFEAATKPEKYLKAVVSGDFGFKAELITDANGIVSFKGDNALTKKLLSRKFYKIIPTPAGIPIVIIGEFRMLGQLEAEFTGAVHASHTFNLNYPYRTGLEYRNGSWRQIDDDLAATQSYVVDLSGEAGASAELRLIPEFEISVYRLSAVTGSIEPYLYANVEVEGDARAGFGTEQEPWAQGDYRVNTATAGAGIDAKWRGDLGLIGDETTVGFSYPATSCSSRFVCSRADRASFELIPATDWMTLPVISEITQQPGTSPFGADTLTLSTTITAGKLMWDGDDGDNDVTSGQWYLYRKDGQAAYGELSFSHPTSLTDTNIYTGANYEPGIYEVRFGAVNQLPSIVRQYRSIMLDLRNTEALAPDELRLIGQVVVKNQFGATVAIPANLRVMFAPCEQAEGMSSFYTSFGVHDTQAYVASDGTFELDLQSFDFNSGQYGCFGFEDNYSLVLYVDNNANGIWDWDIDTSLDSDELFKARLSQGPPLLSVTHVSHSGQINILGYSLSGNETVGLRPIPPTHYSSSVMESTPLNSDGGFTLDSYYFSNISDYSAWTNQQNFYDQFELIVLDESYTPQEMASKWARDEFITMIPTEDVFNPILDAEMIQSFIPPGGLLPPGNVRAQAGTAWVDLSWDRVQGATSYNIYYAEQSFGDPINLESYAIYSGGTLLQGIAGTNHSVSNLDIDTSYYFVVSSINDPIRSELDSLESIPSIEVKATPALPLPVIVSIGRLNDTGITPGGDYPNGNNLNCSGETIAQQDCSHGRDATHLDHSDGDAGFNFTKLDIGGSSLPADALSWSCVRDNVTGRVWEVKTDDGGIHDKDNSYRWGGVGADPYGTDFYKDWDLLVNSSNNENLCGFNDWRVPKLKELQSIINYGRSNPAIDTAYFPNSSDPYIYWSSTGYARQPENIQRVIFSDGQTDPHGRRNSRYSVRLVRGPN